MKKYKWYLFDLDNTILDFNKSSKIAFQKTLDYFSIDFNKEIYGIYSEINHAYWEQYEERKIDSHTLRIGRFKDFAFAINSNINSKIMGDIYLENLILHSAPIVDCISILDQLFNKSKLAIITNGLSDVQHLRIEKHQLNKYFKHIFISDEMGVSKPSKDFFKIVHQKIEHIEKKEVLVIGDNPKSDILGGNNFGFDTLFFNYLKQDTSHIKSTYKISNWNEFI